MWYRLGQFILKYRLILLLLLLATTGVMVYYASKIEMSYSFSKAVPTDNVKYIEYESFRKQFGEDGSMLVLGFEAKDFYTVDFFNKAHAFHQNLKAIKGVEEVMSAPEVIMLTNDSVSGKLLPKKIFHAPYTSQALLDADKAVFESQPFYRELIYNPATHAYLFALTLNKDIINSKARTGLVNSILDEVKSFEQSTHATVQISGLPYIRTMMANSIAKEMNWFLIASLLLSAVTLMLFFRSFNATLMSLLVVGMGVVWSMATMVLLGYKITLITALIPPLIVVIGIPNCIYFLNKYHTAYREKGNKHEALVTMVGRMGIVTLFCNIAAAIGFAVFSFTRSELLQEFGIVSGINIMMLFVISLIFIPSVLSYLPAPKDRHVRYLDSKLLEKLLIKIEKWTFQHTKWVYMITAIITVVSIAGMFRLKSEGFIVDDLPKDDKIYTDLKWFENNFGGVMPLEIVIDTKKKNGLLRNLKPIQKIDEFSQYVAANAATARPLSLVEGLKFARQGFYGGDSSDYAVPTEFDIPVMSQYLKGDKDSAKSGGSNAMNKLLKSFVDSNKQVARISVNMKDIGSKALPLLIDDFQKEANKTFDTAQYKVTFTGSSITFLEGTSFIINGLKESIFWAFILIALCMLYLFRSFRILLCSLIPNLIPLLVTAGVMGWAGVSIKPSTVLVFSVALGIAIDVTIRFLVNYKQELPGLHYEVQPTLIQTIKHTGVSIIYTSLVLIAGFIIFSFSKFGGTKALGWLTSLTLVVGTLTNLVLLPVLLWMLNRGRGQKK